MLSPQSISRFLHQNRVFCYLPDHLGNRLRRHLCAGQRLTDNLFVRIGYHGKRPTTDEDETCPDGIHVCHVLQTTALRGSLEEQAGCTVRADMIWECQRHVRTRAGRSTG